MSKIIFNQVFFININKMENPCYIYNNHHQKKYNFNKTNIHQKLMSINQNNSLIKNNNIYSSSTIFDNEYNKKLKLSMLSNRSSYINYINTKKLSNQRNYSNNSDSDFSVVKIKMSCDILNYKMDQIQKHINNLPTTYHKINIPLKTKSNYSLSTNINRENPNLKFRAIDQSLNRDFHIGDSFDHVNNKTDIYNINGKKENKNIINNLYSMNWDHYSDIKKQHDNRNIDSKNSFLINKNYNNVNTPAVNNIKNYFKGKLTNINKLKIYNRNIPQNFSSYKMEFGSYDKYFIKPNLDNCKLLNYMSNKKNSNNSDSFLNNTDIHNKTVKKMNYNNNDYKDKKKQIEQINKIINKIQNHNNIAKQENIPVALNKITNNAETQTDLIHINTNNIKQILQFNNNFVEYPSNNKNNSVNYSIQNQNFNITDKKISNNNNKRNINDIDNKLATKPYEFSKLLSNSTNVTPIKSKTNTNNNNDINNKDFSDNYIDEININMDYSIDDNNIKLIEPPNYVNKNNKKEIKVKEFTPEENIKAKKILKKNKTENNLKSNKKIIKKKLDGKSNYNIDEDKQKLKSFIPIERNVYMIKDIEAYKKKGIIFPGNYKEKKINPIQVKLCKKFSENPQHFYTAKLTKNMINTINKGKKIDKKDKNKNGTRDNFTFNKSFNKTEEYIPMFNTVGLK